MSIELKPCPNCGGQPKIHKTHKKFYVECDGDCWTQTGKHSYPEDAVKEWNTQIAVAKEDERMIDTKLLPCPFCGGEAEIHDQPIYMDNGVCIKCTECHARSKFIPFDCNYVDYRGEQNVYISKERATNDAINLWNRRADK